ncbi:aminoglycoside phosphotransferase family protein [bacterium]|nr:aminoglycoside phosphotransferase family protein [bacterium]
MFLLSEFLKWRLHSVSMQFEPELKVQEVSRLKGGHINSTYHIHGMMNGRYDDFVLQRLNTKVFTEPDKVMNNIGRVCQHLRKKVREEKSVRIVPLQFRAASDGRYFFIDDNGEFWRVMEYVKGGFSVDHAETVTQAYETGKAFGEFQYLLNDIPGGPLEITIPRFHDTVFRFEQLLDAYNQDAAGRAASVKEEMDFCFARKDSISCVLDGIRDGSIPERVTHNDTKINNVLLDANGKRLCVIDYDTLMPGSSLYDVGDCVRSTTRTGDEDERDLDKINMDISLFEGLVRGYVSATKNILSEREKELLYFCGNLITFEIGLRFLADHLNGDVYFQTERENHNLDRARVQFKMVKSMEEQKDAMRKIVDDLLKEN